MLMGTILLPVMDALAKYLTNTGELAPGQISFYRFALQFLFTAPLVVLVGGIPALRPKRPWLNLFRGGIIGVASLCFFTALKYMPVADTIAIFFVEPFILTALSALILREKVGWRRWAAIVIGFVGALIVINPSFARFGGVALLPLGTAALMAVYLLMNRALGRVDTPLVMQYVAGFGGSLLVGVVLLLATLVGGTENFAMSLPGGSFEWSILLVMGCIASFGHVLVVKAFQLAPVSLLAPFQYVEIVSAAIVGYLLFDDFPEPSKLVGMAIIVASGLFLLWRERRLGLHS
ncbi:DMT family transporter [Pararhizobium mangrovi]|uniref:DMT family transporter n=2 Tax=Pararhizobium mangrovi TaxID=2590452 RepID=A0A506U799_9HYPH|nr:DMT family transporter [Pararhizobium mangrovi]